MGLFDDMLKDGESLLREEGILDFDYLPDLLPYRENQQAYIAECIKPLARGQRGKSLLINGSPGIGKTSCVKYVLRQLEESTDEIKSVFVNCWKKQTTNAVLTDIANQLGAIGSQFKNTDDLWDQIFKRLSKFRGVAIALDEIDQCKEYDFLYQLAENIKMMTLVMITNEKEFLAGMDSRIRSRLVVEELEFKAYRRDEIEGILGERRKLAFRPGSWSPEAFDLVVEKCSAKGDVRLGLVLMREAARAAEKQAAKRITVEHVMKSKASIVEEAADSGLDEKEKKVLQAIRENRGIESGKLAEVLKSQGMAVPESTLRRILTKLDKGGYIFREPAQTDTGGNTMRHFVDE